MDSKSIPSPDDKIITEVVDHSHEDEYPESDDWSLLEGIPDELIHKRETVYKIRVQAMRGKRVPDNVENQKNQLAIIRGIRHHSEFATELHSGPNIKYTRALNARSIMSNVIPCMDAADELPYCI